MESTAITQEKELQTTTSAELSPPPAENEEIEEVIPEYTQSELLEKVINSYPPLPKVALMLRDCAQDTCSSWCIEEVTGAISDDPLLRDHLINLVNSPFYGFSNEIVNLRQIVSLLGINNVASIAIATFFESSIHINVSPYGLEPEEFIIKSRKAVSFVSDWFSSIDKKFAQELIPCILLLRAGMVLFSKVLLEVRKDKAFLESLKANNYDITLVENEFFGTDHLKILADLFEKWKFDDLIVESAKFIENPGEAPIEAMKNAYVLAIANAAFGPRGVQNKKKVSELVRQARKQAVNINIGRLIEICPFTIILDDRAK
ncbi:HDOD domain-containing protein [Helicobacter marmotae]|uniref:HDOD domain-containing protein n=1 Tax=Helicobacter marmotae TaxID=152490 RepID=A0A3D8I2L2_9HELI|nr:HDOD domain-containing protein [Helicobacter marmotae]RDU59327.1 HDOD domain-containing protein [Helicobacter marmotae]